MPYITREKFEDILQKYSELEARGELIHPQMSPLRGLKDKKSEINQYERTYGDPIEVVFISRQQALVFDQPRVDAEEVNSVSKTLSDILINPYDRRNESIKEAYDMSFAEIEITLEKREAQLKDLVRSQKVNSELATIQSSLDMIKRLRLLMFRPKVNLQETLSK